MKKIFNSLFFCLGFFCTMNAVALKIGATSPAVYNFVILGIVLLRILEILLGKSQLKLYKYKYPWYLLFISILFSLIAACFVLTNDWINNSLTLTIKFSVLIFSIILLFDDVKLLNYRKYFFKGLMWAIVIQFIWGIAQLLLWNIAEIQLNQLVFADLLGSGPQEVDWDSLMGGVIMRMTGLSWEPANFAMVLLVGFVLTDSKYLRCLFAFGLIFSTSKTGYIVLILLLFIKFIKFCWRFKAKVPIKFKITWKKLGMLLIMICGILYVSVFEKERIEGYINTFFMMTNFLSEALFSNTNVSADIHRSYYTQLFDLWSQTNLFNILFGYGYFSSGYAYQYIIPLASPGFIWNPESDFITMFVGNGIFGGIVYYFLLFKSYKLCKTEKGKELVLVFAMAGITYLYLRGTWTLLILLFLYIKEKPHELVKSTQLDHITQN